MVIPEGYKKTEIGIIPEDWDIGTVESFGFVVSGGTPSTTNSLYWNGNICWCTPTDIKATTTPKLCHTQKFITEKGLADSSAFLLPINSLMICTRATIGEIRINGLPMATNQGFKNIIVKNGDYLYLYYILTTKKQKMIKLSYGTTFLELSKKALCTIPIQIPKASEQHAISNALYDIDILIDNLEKLIVKKKNIKQGAMQELLTGKCRLSGFSKAWKIEPLFLLCTKITDGSHESPLESRSNYYMPSVKDMTSRGFDYSGCKQISKVDYERLVQNGCEPIEGDVLIAKDGSILKHVFVYKETKHTVILSSIAIIRPDSRKIYGQFLAHFFRQSIIVDNVIRNNKTGTGVPRIVLENFKRVPISYPPTVEEQKAISSILDAIDNEINALEKKLAKYRNLKQGMMSELLTGHIRLTEKEDT